MAFWFAVCVQFIYTFRYWCWRQSVTSTDNSHNGKAKKQKPSKQYNFSGGKELLSSTKAPPPLIAAVVTEQQWERNKLGHQTFITKAGSLFCLQWFQEDFQNSYQNQRPDEKSEAIILKFCTRASLGALSCDKAGVLEINTKRVWKSKIY